jgi:hypothetical protein
MEDRYVSLAFLVVRLDGHRNRATLRLRPTRKRSASIVERADGSRNARSRAARV